MELTLGRLLSIWWAFAWRGVVFGALAGALAGGVAGLAGGLYQVSSGQPVNSQLLGSIAGTISSIPISIWLLGVVLRKRYRGFRLVLEALPPQ